MTVTAILTPNETFEVDVAIMDINIVQIGTRHASCHDQMRMHGERKWEGAVLK